MSGCLSLWECKDEDEGMYTKIFEHIERPIAALLFAVLLLSEVCLIFLLVPPKIAEALQVTIDATAETTGASHDHGGPQTVFINDQTGYKFYRSAAQTGINNGECVYRKTTNAGGTWGSPILIDDQGAGTDCIGIAVWYDRWTPGGTGDYIHVATIDNGTSDVFYNRIDTANSDTRLNGSTAVSVAAAQGQSNVLGANYVSITRGTDGTVYISQDDTSDSFVVECSASCNLSGSWAETGTRPQDLANDYSILVPLASGDIMLINRDISADDIRTKVWNNSTWSGSWTTIDAGATENAGYDVGMAAVVSSTTPGRVYLAYTASNATFGTDDEVRSAYYNGSSWVAGTDVLTGTARGVTNVAIGLDGATNNVYVAYTARTTAGTANTGNVYWKFSTDNNSTWSTEKGPINTSADDMYGVDINNLSDQRMYATWFDGTDADIFGDTLEDIFPGIHASSTGTQTANAFASTSNFYVGGAFSIFSTYKSHDITGITITEEGTIDGDADISNIKLFYEMDTTSPYNCASVSYGGSESQFGSTDTNGFSGANGVSSFTGTTVNVATTSALCLYPVMTILDSTLSGSTIQLTIADPSADVTVTGGTAGPTTTRPIPGVTTVLNDRATQEHFHFRNDDGSEAAATSRTAGVEDTALTSLAIGSPLRIRMEVSNEGGSSTPPHQFRLEYAEATGACSAATGWTDVGATNDDFNMYPTANLTEAANTTNIAAGIGGVTNENTTFLTPNGGVRDTASQTGSLVLSTTNYVELEYSVIASTTATEGSTYCFRLTNAGIPLFTYDVYPSVTVSADVNVTVSGTQTASVNIPTTNSYLGGTFVITENTASRDVTSITVTASGTVDAAADLSSPRLYMDFDTVAPYDCAAETYGGGETNIAGSAFSGPNGSTTFTGTMNITTTRTLCGYIVVNVGSGATNNEKLDIQISNPATQVVVTGGGSVSPSTPRAISGVTTLSGPVLTQIRSHWRRDNGSEAAATSFTAGVEDTAITDIDQATPVRLRLEVSNEGAVTSASLPYRIEFGTKITTCSAISTWIDVGAAGGAWDMFNSSNLTEGANTTNIAAGIGGVTNENTTFLTPNSAVKDTSSLVASTTLSSTQYLEMEFSMQQTANAGYDTTYCFRVSNGNNRVLQTYTRYPELTTAPERDFKIQQGTTTMTGTTITITAGVDYDAPASTSTAFIRMVGSHYTGAGHSASGNTQNADDVTAYISNPLNIGTSVTFTRAGATNDTRISWEIIEFIGAPGADNEMAVRAQSSVTYGINALIATGTAVSNIDDDTDVVVFITGALNPDTLATDWNTMQATAAWNASTNQPVFTRGESSGDAVILSYAVVEFKGPNWKIQRIQHTYTSAGTTETEPMTSINSTSRAFVHAQKRVGTGLQGLDEFGHEVWISSVGFVSFFLESGASTPTDQTSVAWIIENTQTTAGAMKVWRSNDTSVVTTEPLTLSLSIGATVDGVNNTSIFVTTRAVGTGTNFPRVIAGAIVATPTTYQLWRSDSTTNYSYRTEIVEWPTAALTVRQNYYRFYVDNNALDPTDPWPSGGSDLGENTVLTGADEPLGESERIRIRMSIQVLNSTLPEFTRAYKLQYGVRDSTCSAIDEGDWEDVGAIGSAEVWRGYNAAGLTDATALSTDPPTGGDLNLSVSDVSGTLEEANDSVTNVFTALESEDIEYDWIVQQNGAAPETFYCFRMVESNGTVLGGYVNYPQLRTSSFTPTTQNWRWYNDETSTTPTVALANENIAPPDIPNGEIMKLRVTVKETENISRDDVRFKVQFSEYAGFDVVHDVVATTSCNATSTWCYANGGGADNSVIASRVLTDGDSCSAGVGNGCGTRGESPNVFTGFRHNGNAATEYEFTIRSAGPRVNRVYYFRLYDISQDIPVLTNTGEAYPSLVTEGGSLSFSMAGVASSTVIEGVTTDIPTTPTGVSYGTLTLNAEREAAQRFTVTTNATEGYQVFMYIPTNLTSTVGADIDNVTGTNASPASWAVGCAISATGCFGYHTGDGSLQGGSTRFFADNTYAGFETTPREVAFSSIPSTNETTDVVYKVEVQALQEAGIYETNIVYIAVPVF